MTFDKICHLTDEVMDFLIECGGPYQGRSHTVEANLILSITTGMYLYKEKKYFVSYLMVTDDEIYKIKEIDPPEYIPEDIVNGDYMYVTECGCKEGMREIVKELRRRGKKGVCWNRKYFKNFPKQQGALA